ncbi:MAG TPA: hypothetical protein VFQ13_07170 [Anaerolineales bacterium]|nr:hypothetical protein [Anaerolineales bacterium]
MLNIINFETLSLLLQTFVGLAGVFVALAVYQHSKRLQQDNWQRLFSDIHASFWNDKEIKQARHWLAYPRAYREIRKILIQRQKIDVNLQEAKELTEVEYTKLDILDKYLSLLTRIVGVNPDLPKQRELWKSVFFKYWMDKCFEEDRPELVWYIQNYFEVLYDFQMRREKSKLDRKR